MIPAPAPPLARSPRPTGAWAFGAVGLVVVALFWASAHDGLHEVLGGSAERSYYNLLVEGFQDGHLSLRQEVPAGLARLPDPYDPDANHAYRVPPTLADDLSLYQGKFYLYFGITPALLLFWPWAALTGHYLPARVATAGFCTVGFLASLGVLQALWRRHFPAVRTWIAAAGALALGLATGLPVLLQRSDVYEVSISCAYMLTLLALAALVRSREPAAQPAGWVAAASLALGLAVGARPTALFCAPLLALPFLLPGSRPSPRAAVALAAAAFVPLAACGGGLMLYNARRFGSPFEFGQHYQLSGIRQDTVRHFSPAYLWFNFRVYFLEPLRWHPRFPFLGNIAPPPLPPGHGIVEQPFSPFGVLPNIPFTLFALAAPLAWRAERGPGLRCALAGAAILFAAPAAVTLLFFGTCSRYEVEFLPGLVLLAALGVLALESADLARGPRRAARLAWGAALAFSVAVNLGASLERYVAEHAFAGRTFSDLGHQPEAIAQLQAALRVQPADADALIDLGVAQARAGRMAEAVAAFQATARADPARAEAHDDLGNALVQLGRFAEGIAEYRLALARRPDSARTHYNLALALLKAGQPAEAQREYTRALQLNPALAPR